MGATRQFLGVDRPLIASVRDELAARSKRGGRAMDHLLVVAPTQQAGRRLREALAGHGGGGLLAPRVITPAQLLVPDSPPPDLAGPLLVRAVWADVIRKTDFAEFSHLFPGEPPAPSYGEALRVGRLLDQLRHTLLEGGLGFIDVAERYASELPEPDRWADLANLERRYFDALHRTGRRDPCAIKRRTAQAPPLRDEIERVIVVGVPDAAPIVRRGLASLADQRPVEVWIHAPEAWADGFDPWGKPIPDFWERQPLEIPEAAIVLAGSEEDQARAVLRCWRERAPDDPNQAIAIAAPDRSVVPHLRRVLEDAGIQAFDPAPRSIAEHRAVRVAERFGELLDTGRFSAFSRLLRHPDLLVWLDESYSIQAAPLLDQLDRLQRRRLPQTMRDVVRAAREGDGYGGLSTAVAAINDQLHRLRTASSTDGLLGVLQSVYRPQVADPDRDEDAWFMRVAREITSAVRECDRPAFADLDLSGSARIALWLEHLRSVRLNPERRSEPLDIEGWLELPWNDAPALVIAGFNEGVVPESVEGDPFLSDAARRRLGLRDNRDRLARDAFLLRALLASREPGAVRLVVGKTNRAGDPLKPSRLLFHCDDQDLPKRAARLFGEPADRPSSVPVSISFRLDPGLLPGESDRVDSLPVTAFDDYLACPFRFYLRRVLGMEPAHYPKEELDPADFGRLVHASLRDVLGAPATRGLRDPAALGDRLAARAAELASGQWGPALPLPVRIQLHSAQQRLRRLAAKHVDWLVEGWEPVEIEVPVAGSIGSIRVTGQIDRIDRHRRTGVYRILDYKTSEQPVDPARDHLGSVGAGARPYAILGGSRSPQAWRRLQLPLYCLLWTETAESLDVPVEAGYVQLPKAVHQTDLKLWPELDAATLDSARDCAAGVVDDIRHGRFWPPANQVPHDDFAFLYPGLAADAVDPPRPVAQVPADGRGACP